MSFGTFPLRANPQGANIVHGDVRIGSGAGGNLQIRQNSASAIIDWERFSIDAGELTQFRQPNSRAAVLNRVTGGNPSAIHGALKGNGNVFLINPNGILVGPGGTIDVHGLVLSSLDVENGEFLAGGDMKFAGAGKDVTNLGRINAIGGDVFLIGRTVTNSGSISANSGTVGLAAGEEVLLTAGETATGERMFVRASGSGAGGNGVLNDGSIEGAAVELKAHGNLYALAINNKGSVRATGASNSGGRVFLRAPGGSVQNSGSVRATSSGIGRGGRVLIEAAYAKVDGMIRAQEGEVRITGQEKVDAGGSIDVSNTSGKGGSVVVEGAEIALGNGSIVDASGATGGGNIRIGGGFQGRDATVQNADTLAVADGAVIVADATSSGSGGNVILWADGNTSFAGSLSARGVSSGGFAEISGKETLEATGEIDLTATDGTAGTLLLDPTNITISATGASGLGGSTISNVWLSQQLDLGNNVVISTNFGSGGAGNIVVGRTDTTANASADRIQWYQNSAGTPGGTLTFLAMGNINFNTSVQSAGTGGVNVVAGWDGTTGWSGAAAGDSGSTITFDIDAVLATINDGNAGNDAAGLNGGSIFLGATNARLGVAVGSRWGDTKVAAHDLVLRGSTTIGHGWAQLGFNDNGVEFQLSRTQNGVVLNEWWGAAAGNVQSKDYITLLGGTEFSGGNFRGAGWGATGDIVAGLSGRLDARSGTTASHVQIGHGGTLRDGSERKQAQNITGGADTTPAGLTATTRDNIVIAPGSNRYSFFSSTWRTNYAGSAARIDGDISIKAAEDVLFMAARGFDGVTDMQDTNVNDGAYALIGHGGVENQGSFHGDISVIANGVTSAPTSAADNNGLAGLGIQILGGRGTRSFAMVGHGSGYEGNFRSIWDQTRSGNITLDAVQGAIRIQAHNQAIRTGTSNATLNSGALIADGVATEQNNASDASNLGSFVQIGHGGQASALQAAGGTFMMPGGTNVTNITPDASMSGDISVHAGGTYSDPENADTPIGILLRAGNRRWYHAMIGHGGVNQNAINTVVQTPAFGAATLPFGSPALAASTGFNGAVSVNADTGSVIAAGGDSFRADRVWGYGYNFVRVGHGGDTVRGAKGGAITVSAGQGSGAISGDILFQAGRMQRDHAMIGHGGLDSDGVILGNVNDSRIEVIARGDIGFTSPTGGDHDALNLSTDWAYWWFSNASATGTPQTGNTNWVTTDRFVQLGHGGYASTSGMLDTTSGGQGSHEIVVRSGTGDLANTDGDDLTGGISFVSGDTDRSYAQLGHGGHSANATIGGYAGNIVVRANGGALTFDGSVLGAQVSTRATDISLNGSDLVVTRADNSTAASVVIRGQGGGIEAYSQLGHGGYGARGVHSGDIDIQSWGGVSFVAAPASPTVDRSVTNAPINAALAAGTNVWVALGNLVNTASPTASNFRYQMPEQFSNIVPGTLRIVLSDGSVITDLPNASSDDRTSNLVRNGVTIGQINYDNGLVRFQVGGVAGPVVTGLTTQAVATFQTAQGLKERAYVQLGHGGFEADSPNNKANDLVGNTGNISVLAGGDIRFEGGAAHRNYAQLGHGGLDNKGAHSGNITIDKVDANHLVGGLGFLAGYGGHRQYDYHSYAQLGHGGNEADGNHFGNLYVRATEDAEGMGLFMKAGNRQDASVQIGHGGYNARTGGTTAATAFGLNGNIDIQVTGDVAAVAGTMTMNNPAYRDDGRLYVQIGHGGYDADAANTGTAFLGQTGASLPAGTAGAGNGNWGHFGDITLVSTGGNISFMGGSTIPVADRLDLDGNPILSLSDPNGYLTSRGDGTGRLLSAQIGHGGYSSSGDHRGNITVTATNGSVNLVGGMMSNDNSAEKYNWSQIGHGGAEAQGHLGRNDETISVRSGGDIVLAAGQGNRNQAHIGNGGLNFDGSHTGTIRAYAGGNIRLRGGMALERIVRRIGEFQDMIGADGGNANDVGEFNGYYGSGGLGYLPMDEAAFAGGGQKTKLIGDEIQPGTVEFRLAIAAPTLFDAAQTPNYVDDGNGNIVAYGTSTVVGTINYSTGEISWTTAILSSDTDGQPDLFVNYDHRTGIRNDALYANATIGHGGYASGSRVEALPGGGTNLGINGAIDVRAGVTPMGAFNGMGGSISAIAGNDQRTYVQIGHGGMDSGTPAGHAFAGAITTKADGGIVFRGGGGLVDNHMIGFNYYGTGGTEVASVTAASNADAVSPRYATAIPTGTRTNSGTSDINYAFAHIGHGGVTAHANNGLDNNLNDPLVASNNPATGHNGNILVETASGNIDFTGGGGTGNYHFAMIGHGGLGSLGNHYGGIEVISGADINFTGGGLSYRSGATSAEGRSFVQIGHGGHALTGNLEGEIEVSSVGSINFRGGDNQSDRTRVPYGAHVHTLNWAGNQDDNHFNRTDMRQTHAMIGHGGSYVYGDKTGNIGITAGDGLNFRGGDRLDGSLDNNAGYLNFAQIGHGGYQSWRQYRANNPLPSTAGAADDWNLPFWWDGTQYVFDGTFGPLGDGQFFWPTDNAISAAQGRGNPLNDGFGGNISVTATGGDIRFASGTGMGTFSRIGHGGVETGGDHNGEVTVRALAGDILFSANRIEETGSTSTASNAFVQIGHGGGYSSGEQSGTINVSASGEISFKGGRVDNFAMIGHGGRESHSTQNGQVSGTTTYRRSTNFLLNANTFYRPGTRSGDIHVTAGGDIDLIGGNSVGDRAFVQIGHGGYNIHANPDPNSQFGNGHNGAIDVVSTGGSILLMSGQATNAHAQIGHGGTQSFGNHGGDGNDNRLDSDILVQSLTGIKVMASGRFSTNATSANQAQIGHGGRQSSFRDIEDIDANLYARLQPYTGYTNPITGLVNVDNAGLHPLTPFLNNTNSTGTEGLGLGMRATLGTFMGDITVRTTGVGADIRFLAPNESEGTLGINGTESYVQLGHGGFRAFANIEGNITVDSAGSLEFSALQGKALAPNVNSNHNLGFALLGHGGFESGGTYIGNIKVDADGDISFHGAQSVNGANAGFAQLGHGGYNVWKGTTQYREAIRDSVSGVIPAAVLSIGSTGNIDVTSGGNIEFTAGRDAITYAQIGHGGWTSRDSHSGNITVSATGGIAFYGGVDYPDIDTASANPGGNEQSHAMIGHGGYDSDGTHSGNISVSAGQFGAGHAEAGQGIVFRAGAYNDNFAQMGHGGANSRTYGSAGNEQGLNGFISASAIGDITFVGGTANFYNSDENARLYAQLGHGGYDVDVTQDGSHVYGAANGGHSGDITVTSTGGRIFFGAGDAERADQASVGLGEGRFHWAQMGHGGYESRGDHHGNITVSAATDVVVLGGSSEDNDGDLVNYGQIGHGGRTAVGNQGLVTETISVTAGRDIIFRAGNGQDSPVQLGNGGRDSRGAHSGNLVVRAGGNIEFSGVLGRHVVTNEERGTFDLTRATEFGTQGSDAIYDLEGSNVVPGTVVITIPNGPEIRDDGKGNLVIASGDSTVLSSLGLVIGEVVGTIFYTTGSSTNGRLTFIKDVNPNNLASPAVASMTTVSYASMEVQGSWAQLGNGGYNADTTDNAYVLGNRGNIQVFAEGDVSFNGGIGAQAYAQLGHGGYINDGPNSGNIGLGSALERIGGAVTLTGGTSDFFDGADAYAMIGHGGRTARGNHSGDIAIYAGTGQAPALAGIGVQLKSGTRNNNFTLIGHGGTSSRSGTGNGAAGMGGNSGNITVDAIGSVNVIAGVLNQGSGTLAQLNDDGNLYAHIGHGGYEADVSIDGVTVNGNGLGHHGDITVISRQGGVNVLAGDHTRSFLPSFAPAVGIYDGLTNNGLARADAAGGGRFHYAMIGHGGYEARGNHYGNLTVHAGYDAAGTATGGSGSIVVQAGTSYADQDGGQHFAQIGHGGRTALGDHGRVGEILSVKAAGDLAVRAGSGIDAYAMIGNGGTNTRGDHAGDVSVFANGTIDLVAGQLAALPGLGNGLQGGYIFTGTDATNSIDRAANLLDGGNFNLRNNRILAGSVTFDVYNDLGVKIGTVADTAGNGELRVISDFTELVGGVQFTANQQVGTINSAAYANGGTLTVTFTSDINPGADDGVANLVLRYENTQTDRSFVQIGHGGYDADNVDGDLVLGNRGSISVTAASGDIVLRGGTDDSNYVTIGHGGRSTSGANSGEIEVMAGGNLEVRSGAFLQSYASIGHGGYLAPGDHSGDICVHVGKAVLLDSTAGNGQFTFTRIGHGGQGSPGNLSGHVTVVSGLSGANGGVTLMGGPSGGSDNQFAQIGHGGIASAGNHSGDITVVDLGGGNLSLTGGTGATSYALIGHGDAGGSGGAATTSGTRAGSLLIQIPGSVSLVNGTPATSAAVLGHRSTAATQGVSPGSGATMLIAGTLPTGNFNLSSFIAQGLAGGATTIATTASDLVIAAPVSFNSDFALNLLSLGNVVFQSAVQNSGAGELTAVAGWNGTGGMVAVDFNDCRPFGAGNPFDPTALICDDFGVGGQGIVYVGDGTQSAGVAVGSRTGTTRVLGHGVRLVGGSTTGNAYAQIGFHPSSVSTQPGTGAIEVMARSGGLQLLGGAVAGTYAQIGHGGLGSAANDLQGDILVSFCEPADLLMLGGANSAYAQIGHGGMGVGGGVLGGNIDVTGVVELLVSGGGGFNSYGMIGHGGANASGTTYSGDVQIAVAGDATITAGSGSVAFGQIGHGGASADAAMSGAIGLATGGSISLLGNPANMSYAKIGHGDDLRGSFVPNAGTGNRSGDIEVSAGTDLDLSGALIGHRNSFSPAITLGGITQIGVSRVDPTDAAGGSLTADSASQFEGGDQLRFYVPRRGNNLIAAGAILNGATWTGAPADPSPTQRIDEYTIHITGVNPSDPAEHGNVFGTGPAPANAAGFAFYYDTIESGQGPQPPQPPLPPEPPLPPLPPEPPVADEFITLDDWTMSDWIRMRRKAFRNFRIPQIQFRGFQQYGPNGESIFHIDTSAEVESDR